MPTTGQYNDRYGYEWMDALAKTGGLLDQLFPTLQEYGLVGGQQPQQPSPPPAPMPAITVQPVEPAWYEQIPAWGWAAIGIGGGALLVSLLRG